MNLLSLFDGISCGQLALKRAAIHYTNYYASEIDKYAIQITQKHFPKTIQLGDVCNIKNTDLPKIDLLIGGSPCQGFSCAGKGLNFDDPRSKLFFEFVRLLKKCKPKWFLLENVKMKQEWQDIISDHLGVKPIKINSALVSAQNRVRLYWTNIEHITQPIDKNIVLADIIENKKLELRKDFKSNALTSVQKHTLCKVIATASIKNLEMHKRIYDVNFKSPALTTMNGGNSQPKIMLEEENSKGWRNLTPIECERLQTIPDNYTAGISNTQRYKTIGNAWTVDVIAHILKHLRFP